MIMRHVQVGLRNPPGGNEMVGMILTTFNMLEKTRECIISLRLATSCSYTLVAVDNASTDGTCEFLEENGVEVIRNSSPVHLTVALNQGLSRHLQHPDINYLSWIHNDMRFYKGWLDNLIKELDADPRIGKLAPYNILKEGRTDEDFAQEFMASHQGQIIPGNECPWIMPKHVVEKVGLFDEGYVACGGYEDWDYNNRVLDAGYLVAITLGSVVWHETMGTRKHIPQEPEARANGERYFKKWGQWEARI